MKTSLFAIILAAAGLSAGLAVSVSPASAAPTCSSAVDVGCKMPSHLFLRQEVAVGDEGVVISPTAAPAYPATPIGNGQNDRCTNITGGGSGMPAYLYGKCP